MKFLSALLLALTAAWSSAQGGDPKTIWPHLEKTYDKNGDGKIVKAEYPRGDRAFTNLDRNGDGELTAADFERRGRAPGSRRSRPPSKMKQTARRLGDLYGSFINRDGKPGVSKPEWESMIERLRPDKNGVIDPDGVEHLVGVAGKGRMARYARDYLPRILDTDKDETITVAEVRKLFAEIDADESGVLEAGTEILLPPGVGEVAPDFTLAFADNAKKSVTLSSYRGKRPVCLIFGSYT